MTSQLHTVTFAQLASGTFGAERHSEWLTIDQESVTAFGLLTRDPDPNHIDPEWASVHSPFGGPVAFGFQSLSMLTFLAQSAGAIPRDAAHVVNYGFNHVRFVAPVRVGQRVRGHFSLAGVVRRGEGQILVTYAARIEIEDETQPALVAKWLALYEGTIPA